MAGAGFGEEVQISWRGGGWGGAQRPPQQHTKTSVGCKDETAQRGYFQQVDCFVASLVGSCSSSVLWVVAIAVVVVVVAVGSRCCCCGSELEPELVHPPYKSLSRRSEPELELEPVHPPRVDNCVVDPNSNCVSPPPGVKIVVDWNSNSNSN